MSLSILGWRRPAINQLLRLRRGLASATEGAYDINTNAFRAKRQWPPDFSKLSQKHQFRLERRYRRRSKLKWARPQWNKFVQLAQWGSVTCMQYSRLWDSTANSRTNTYLLVVVIIYAVFFMDVNTGTEEESPFDPVGTIRSHIQG